MAEITTIKIRGEDKSAAAFRSANRGLDRLERNLQAASAKTAALSGGLAKMGGLMAGLVGVGALGSFAKSILTTGDRLQKVSLQLGLTVDELEILQFAASQSGVESTALNTSLQKLTVNLGKAAEGTKAQKDAFEALGISVADADGNLSGTSETFVRVAEAISGIEDPAKKAQIATDLFGRAGVELLPLLNSGAAGISQFAGTIREAGGIIGQDGADEISKFNDGMDLLSRSLRGKVAPVLVAILPALTTLAENLDEIAKFAAVVGTAFIVAKIPAMFAAITLAVKGLTLAMATNPLGLIATGLAAIAVYKGDEIMDAFGFAEEAPKDLKETNTKLEDTAKQLKELDKIEEKRVETSEEYAKTTKKKVVPNLKSLDKALKASSIEFKNIRGPEGLGGLTKAFIEFFGNIHTVALNTLTDIEGLVRGTFGFVKQDFREFFQALDNIVVFEGQEVRNAFRSMMRSLKAQIETKDIEAKELFRVIQNSIDAVDLFSVSGHIDRSASSILNVTGTKTVSAPDIFRVSGTLNINLDAIESNTKAAVRRSMTSIADYVNHYGVRSNYTPIGHAGARKMGYSFGRNVNIDYTRAIPEDTENFDYKTIYSTYPVMTGPGVTRIPGIYGGGRSTGRSPADSLALAESESQKAPVVNVYLDLEGEVKLPLHDYIVGVQNRAERAGDTSLASIVGGAN